MRMKHGRRLVQVLTLSAAASLTLSGCAAMPGMASGGGGGGTCSFNGAAIGTAIGAGSGAALAATFSRGNLIDTLIGTGAGALAGYLIGNYADERCEEAALQGAMAQVDEYHERHPSGVPVQSQQQALNETPRPAALARPHHVPFAPVAWNTTSGDNGVITPLRTYTDSSTGNLCATLNNSATASAQVTQKTQVACKNPDGTWQIASN